MNLRVKQTAALFSSQIGFLALGAISSIVNSRILGPVAFGEYSFVIAIVSFVMIFYGFGLGPAGSRLVATQQTSRDEREVEGAFLIVSAVLALLFAINIIIVAYFVQEPAIRTLLQGVALLSGVSPFGQLLRLLCRGGNRISLLVVLDLMPKTIYLGWAMVMIVSGGFTAENALAANWTSAWLACLIVVIMMKPATSQLLSRLKTLWSEMRQYGFNIYLGGLSDRSTYRLDGLLIGIFVDPKSVGFYALATVLASPIPRISESLSIVLFKDFSSSSHVDKRTLRANLFLLLAAATGLSLFSNTIVSLLYSEAYLEVADLVVPLAIAAVFKGMYTPLNTYLSAQGKGRELRNIAFCVSLVNITGNFSLIYLWGAWGAAIASAISKGAEWILTSLVYGRVVRTADPSSLSR